VGGSRLLDQSRLAGREDADLMVGSSLDRGAWRVWLAWRVQRLDVGWRQDEDVGERAAPSYTDPPVAIVTRIGRGHIPCSNRAQF